MYKSSTVMASMPQRSFRSRNFNSGKKHTDNPVFKVKTQGSLTVYQALGLFPALCLFQSLEYLAFTIRETQGSLTL